MRPTAKGMIDLCIPATDPPIMLARVAVWLYWAGFSAQFAHVGIVNVAIMHKVVVPIFVVLEGGGRTLGLVCARSAKTIPGWLLVAAAVSVTASASASASSSAVVGRALMLRGGVAIAWGLVDVAWGLLANFHAELLYVCQLALHHGQAGGLALH